MEDFEIIELYFQRDQQAVTQTDIKYGNLCRTVSVRIVKDISDAEECVNDTYLKVWNAIPPDRPRSLAAYLGRIVRNLSLDRYRRNNAAKRRCECVPLDEFAECIPDSREDAPDEQLSAVIREFLDSLPQEQRVYFMRRYYLGEPLAEIAKRYGVSANKLGVTMHRLKKLKEHIEKSEILSERRSYTL